MKLDVTEFDIHAMLQSVATHGHLRSKLCCAFYALWAREMLHGTADGDVAWQQAADKTARHIQQMPDSEEAAWQWECNVCPKAEHYQIRGSGYVVDCLHSARWALRQGRYETAVKAAISLGNDTDTTACVAGGLAGLRDGVEAIPLRWRHALRGRETVDALLSRLMPIG